MASRQGIESAPIYIPVFPYFGLRREKMSLLGANCTLLCVNHCQIAPISFMLGLQNGSLRTFCLGVDYLFEKGNFEESEMSKVTDIFVKAGIDDELTLIKLAYAIEVVKTEFVKFIAMAVFFAATGNFLPYCFALLILSPVRVFSGGFHLETKLGCFIFSFAVFLLPIFGPSLLPVPKVALMLALVPVVAITVFCSPIATKKRPIKTQARRKSLKIKSIVFILLDCAVLAVLFWQEEIKYLSVGVWILALQSLQLFASWIHAKWKGSGHNEISSSQQNGHLH
jgi:accessory gene regulator protein AgrB